MDDRTHPTGSGRPVREKERFLVFGQPKIEEAEILEVVDSLRKAWLGTGPKVARFEEAFRAYKQAPWAAALSSCTAALHLALITAGVGPGDEVITTPMTFVATVNSIIHAGGTPVLADIDPRTLNIDPREVRRKISSRTKAILPVHFAGRPCDMEDLLDVSRRNNLAVIEDCAHAIETEYHGRKAGTLGDFGCFSFYATKNLTAGEGGMVLARNQDHIQRIKRLAMQGLSQDAWKRFNCNLHAKPLAHSAIYFHHCHRVFIQCLYHRHYPLQDFSTPTIPPHVEL